MSVSFVEGIQPDDKSICQKSWTALHPAEVQTETPAMVGRHSSLLNNEMEGMSDPTSELALFDAIIAQYRAELVRMINDFGGVFPAGNLIITSGWG